MPNGHPACDGKTACEAFRAALECMTKNEYICPPGVILQMFDEMHQSHRENTGDKCQVESRPVASQCNGVPIRIQVYVPAGDTARNVLGTLKRVLEQWLDMQSNCMSPEDFKHDEDVARVQRFLLLNWR